MRILSAAIGVALVVLPEVVRAVSDERARREARKEADRIRKHDSEQRDLDRKNARICAEKERK